MSIEELKPEDVRDTSSAQAELDAAIAAEQVEVVPEVKEEVKTDVVPPKVDEPALDPVVLTKQVADKEAFIQKQAAELGELRKVAQQLQQPATNQPKIYTQEELDATFYESPSKALAMAEHNKGVQYHAEVQRATQIIQTTERTLKELVPEFDELKPTMVDLALKDGFTQQQLANAYLEIDPRIIYQYALRARANKEINELKGKTVAQVAQKIEQAAKSSGLTSKVAPSATKNTNDTLHLTGEALRKSLEDDLKAEWG
jgi:hypothetical protein